MDVDVQAEEFEYIHEGFSNLTHLLLCAQELLPHSSIFRYTSEYDAMDSSIVDSEVEHFNEILNEYHSNLSYFSRDSTELLRQRILLILDHYGVTEKHLKVSEKHQVILNILNEIMHDINDKGYYGNLNLYGYVNSFEVRIIDQAVPFDEIETFIDFSKDYDKITIDELNDLLKTIKELPNIKGDRDINAS